MSVEPIQTHKKSNKELIDDIQLAALEVRSLCDIVHAYLCHVADPLPEVLDHTVSSVIWTASNKADEISEMAGEIDRQSLENLNANNVVGGAK